MPSCQYWDDDLVIDDCIPDNVTTCLGGWSSEGLTFSHLEDNNTVMVCLTTHLSSFSVGISFKISPPKVSAKNFDPSNSWIIYVTWGSFFAFSVLVYIYSRLERRAYDRRQLQIEQGIITEEIEVKPPPPKGWRNTLGIKVFFIFVDGLKTKVF